MPINSFLYPGAKVTLGYDVDNSLRFNSGSSDYLTNSNSTPTNNDICTFSFWVKFSTDDVSEAIFSAHTDGSNRFQLFRLSSGKMQFFQQVSGSVNMNLTTNRLFRDVSSWYNFVYEVDTSQSTDSNRVKMYVNGVQETSFSTETYPSQNTDIRFNTNSLTQEIGRANGTDYGSYYLAEFVFVDGTALDQTSFGEFDSDSPTIWKPKDVSGLTLGNNGFYLDFENSSGLGNDATGTNHFAVNNLTAVDQSTDTCTNNYATMNPIAAQAGSSESSSVITFTEGNLDLDAISSETGIATIGVDTGKWYWEVKVLTDQDGLTIGGVNQHHHLDAELAYNSPSSPSSAKAFGYYGGNGNKVTTIGDGSQFSSYGDAIAVNDIIGVALNLDDDEVVFYKNGTAQNSGTAISLTALATGELYFPAVGNYSASAIKVSFNFGSPSFSISSGNSDANGYGNFEYSVPSGYYALNSKNLAEFG
jgi:hypothetical protein